MILASKYLLTWVKLYEYHRLYMRNYLSRFFKATTGFTLIELLVVIGILGILAAALVATIDPFEQLKKAQDTNATNALAEFVNGTTRYYTTHTAFPWDAAPDGAGCTSPTTATLLNSANGTCYITALTGDNELKAAFASSSNLKDIYVTYDASTKSVIGCFNPQSKSILHNSNTKYNSNGTTTGTAATSCDTNAHKDLAPTSCFWCTR